MSHSFTLGTGIGNFIFRSMMKIIESDLDSLDDAGNGTLDREMLFPLTQEV